MTHLPANLPANPLPLLQEWIDDAWENANVPHPHAMALGSVAMVDGVAFPSSRIVLIKELVANPGHVVFHTNYQSRKGQELGPGMRASGLLHWDHLGQQVRLEGVVNRAPGTHSDRYFASRDRESRISAWASDQSQPLDSRTTLLRKFESESTRFSDRDNIERPPHWGGLELTIDRLELWCAGEFRLHDRVLWQRQLTIDPQISQPRAAPGPWTFTRLQP